MSQDQSFDVTRIAPDQVSRRIRGRRVPALAAIAVLVAACSGPGAGSPSAAPSSPGGGSASPAGSAPASPALGYPDRPITIVVPFAAGGPTDTVTRLVAEPMSATLGQQIVVQNVAGAGGTLAAGQVAAAAPDGYTVLMHHIGMSTAPSLYPDLPYDPLVDFKTDRPRHRGADDDRRRASDFEPTTLAGAGRPTSRRTRTTVTYANAGIGAASHLCGLLFRARSSEGHRGPVRRDRAGHGGPGRQARSTSCATRRPTRPSRSRQARSRHTRSPARSAIDALPDVPTTTEAGLPDVQVERLARALRAEGHARRDRRRRSPTALKGRSKDANVIDKFADLGTAPVADDQATPEAHREMLQSQIELWKPIIEAAGVTAG